MRSLRNEYENASVMAKALYEARSDDVADPAGEITSGYDIFIIS